MKINRKFNAAAGVFMIIFFASVSHAATLVLDETVILRDKETMLFPFEITEGREF